MPTLGRWTSFVRSGRLGQRLISASSNAVSRGDVDTCTHAAATNVNNEHSAVSTALSSRQISPFLYFRFKSAGDGPNERFDKFRLGLIVSVTFAFLGIMDIPKRIYSAFGNNHFSTMRILSNPSITVIPVARAKASKGQIEESKAEDSTGCSTDKEESAKDGNMEQSSGKQRIGFRDRKICRYEDRIRQYSTPDKIFRYFATLKVNGIVYMTPNDFVRSITPGHQQPSTLGLDKHKKFDPMKDRLDVDEGSIFHVIGDNCLICFTDYMFLIMMLSTPRRQFEIAFRMFDANGDGEVDIEEFSRVQHGILSQTSMGKRHRDRKVTGNTLTTNSTALTDYFFGKDKKKKLTIDEFLRFYQQLHREILKLEFKRYDTDNTGLITEADFARSLITYAQIKEMQKRKMMKRVREKYPDKDDDNEDEGDGGDDKQATPKSVSKGISFKEYTQFFKFLRHINDIDQALTFYNVAGASIDKTTLRHAALTVAKTDLSDHLLDVVFTLFDENGDGELSNKEFISVMKRRVMRGLERSKDTGFTRKMAALFKCLTTEYMLKKAMKPRHVIEKEEQMIKSAMPKDTPVHVDVE